MRRPLATAVLAVLLLAPARAAAEFEDVTLTEAELEALAPEVRAEMRRFQRLQHEVEDALAAEDFAYAERLGAELERSPCATAVAPILHGRALLRLGRAAEAADAARRSLASLELAAGHSLLSRALHALGDLEGAEAEARRAIVLDRLDPRLRWEHAVILADLGRYQEAVQVARTATSEDPRWNQARALVARWNTQARRPQPRPSTSGR